MAVQTGGHCFADAVNAAPSACAAFITVSSVVGTDLITVGCTLANVDGTLQMFRSVAPMAPPGPPVVTAFVQQLNFPPCVEAEYAVALKGIAGPLLGLIFTVWGLWKIYQLLTRQPGKET